MGLTGCGKSKIAIYLRKYLPIEIISVDSALIYRDMDIGTDKPNHLDLQMHPHRLLNIKDPAEVYSVAEFRKDAYQEIENILGLGRIPLLVGGTMLYYHVLLYGLSNLPPANFEIRKYLLNKVKYNQYFLYEQLNIIDPISANNIHKNDYQRLLRALEIFYISGKTLTSLKNNRLNKLPYNIIQFSILPKSKEWLYKKIEIRVKKMFVLGFQKEVESLFFRGDLNKELPSIRCIGYRQMWEYLEHKTNYEEMFSKIVFSTRKLAKNQLTWLKKWKNIYFLISSQPDIILKQMLKIFKKYKLDI
ncbi:tRNA delta(2)-isopentenylpyrophosphate transferase [Buchnera aphidicola (Aphis glycines)]|uniref:tRNA dimethylallyltransferase n=1 Tax=Buchnera aphidicola (Aphis glycines) TaxID=1265350 RepID=A0A0M5K0S4_9GAMM|nr:tRNA (adenosine(37)-N6)-dimethylallyltransferase MiaA [Buchnera aphidicola]ALD15491.1 tRNA delta(2)-isopentenylpyrophosphate transferase [Buchnera aphidicola (Aphis glycines)]